MSVIKTGSSVTTDQPVDSLTELRVTLVQSELHWHDASANLQMFSELTDPLEGKTDLIILPEMFSTGFTMAPENVAEPEQGPAFQWLVQQAKKLNTAICGSVVVQSEQGYHNRFYWVTPEGGSQHYDKRHLFRMAGEHEHYQAGEQRLIIEYKGWRILPQICYDLRFPVWSRSHNDYDLAIYVANWPQVRNHPWQVLLQARAIENLCYVAGVNRVGVDGNELPYSGDSALINFKGHAQLQAEPGEVEVLTTTLDLKALEDFRTAFPASNDADRFTFL